MLVKKKLNTRRSVPVLGKQLAIPKRWNLIILRINFGGQEKGFTQENGLVK